MTKDVAQNSDKKLCVSINLHGFATRYGLLRTVSKGFRAENSSKAGICSISKVYYTFLDIALF
jgi:hypothetical protein